MRNLCSDGYYCCQPTCYEINNNPPSQSNDCENCMLIGGYYVHDPDSVVGGCPGNASNLQIILDRNNYDACASPNTLSFSIIHYDDTYFEQPTIVHSGSTSVFVNIKTQIPHMEYAEIIYKVECSDGYAGFGKLRIASKHLCLDCPCECDECTGDCDEEDCPELL
jgi:hypothetical protein